MTWRMRVHGVVTSVLFLALVAIASGAAWTDLQFGSAWTDLWAGFGW